MTVAVHHLDCAPMTPALALGGRLTPTRMVAHVLLVELDSSLVLVDAGFGTEDLRTRRMGRAFIELMRPSLDPSRTALAQVRALGFSPSDVRDIVLTHMDLDHVGGVGDFPHAQVHVHATEYAAATARASVKEQTRYLPAQFRNASLVTHEPIGETWQGLSSVTVLDDDVLMVPLHGHSRGHTGVAVRRPEGDWLLHAGDAYFAAGEKLSPPSCPPGLALFQGVVEMDRSARLENQQRLRELHAAGDVTVFCAHDAAEFDALAGLPA